MKTLQTAWSIAGITLLLLLFLETALRLTFALRDRLSRARVARSPDPGGRLRRGDLAHRSLPRDRIARGALAALRLFPAQALPRQDDHHRSRRPANDVAGGRSIQKRNREKDAEDTRLGGSSLWGFGAGTTTQSPRSWRASFMNVGCLRDQEPRGTGVRQHPGVDCADA